MRGAPLWIALGIVAWSSAGFAQATKEGARETTWARDVAPIVFERCVACHRPGQIAPFSLLDGNDARDHARQMAKVTSERRMPPWLPEPGFGEFEHERRLSDDEIATFGRWAEQGAPLGDLAAAPPAPKFAEGWQLGPPDLVVEPADAYTLAADGTDVFRNFVVPVELPDGKYVAAVEFAPGNLKVFHHATIFVDPNRDGRRRDARDAEPGFAGMDIGSAQSPDGHFLGWAPGRSARKDDPDMAWRLERGADLLLQAHLLPSGKPETLHPKLGLYFTDQPPTLHPYVLRVGGRSIDIPAGTTNYEVADAFTLPIDVDALAVYPHAHFLGQLIEGFAELPDGTRRWLIRIPRWDFSWQDEYRLKNPLPLPKGSVLRMHFVFDNSAENPRNPNHPPKRVTYGPSSFDEMAELWVQVLPHSSDDRALLDQAFQRKDSDDRVLSFAFAAKEHPDDAGAQYDLGTSLFMAERLDEAVQQFERALALDPNFAPAHVNLGLARIKLGDLVAAEKELLRALELRPDDINTRRNLGLLFDREGRPGDAARELKLVLAREPDAVAALKYAWIRATAADDATRNGKEALHWAQRATKSSAPTASGESECKDPSALDVLAAAYAEVGRFKDAITTCKAAIELARAAGDQKLAERIDAHRSRYRDHQAWRDDAKK